MLFWRVQRNTVIKNKVDKSGWKQNENIVKIRCNLDLVKGKKNAEIFSWQSVLWFHSFIISRLQQIATVFWFIFALEFIAVNYGL